MGDMENESESKANQDVRGAALLSCELCSKRKIRCDKRQPCTACVKAGRECIAVKRPRLPRGRRGGRKEASTELKARVKKLEDIIASLASNPSPPNFQDLPTPVTNESKSEAPNVTTYSSPEADPERRSSSSSKSPTDISRLLGSGLWVQLSSELKGLRSVLEANDEDDEKHLADTSPPHDQSLDLMDSPLRSNLHEEVTTDDLPGHVLTQVLDVYRYNVDMVFKMMHFPTFRNSMETGVPYLGYTTQSSTFQCLKSAAIYTTIGAMTDKTCMACFGEDKEPLRQRWRAVTEHYIRVVDLTNNHNIVVFQALLLYVAAYRAHNNGSRMWTMIGMIVRIGQALQLNREESYSSITFFQAQIHRRCWFTLLNLDYQASFDRGTDPCIPADGFNTKFPADIDDADFGPETGNDIVIQERPHWTEMTFHLIAAECTYLLRELCFVPAGEIGQPPKPLRSNWELRKEAVALLQERINYRYTSNLDPSIPRQFASIFLSKVILCSLQLFVVRPFQRHPGAGPPPQDTLGNVVLLATETLEMKGIFSRDMTKPWHWLFENYVEWHPLATLLAELCSPQRDPQLFQRAWRAADAAFGDLSEKVAEGASGSLWMPIKKLMRMAQQRRAIDQPLLLPTLSQQQVHNQQELQFQHQHQHQQIDWLQMPEASMPMETSDFILPAGADTPMGGLSNPNSNPGNAVTTMDLLSPLAEYDFGVAPMDDSWNNWQFFVDDLAQNNHIGWSNSLWPTDG